MDNISKNTDEIRDTLQSHKLKTDNEKYARKFLLHPYFQIGLIVVILLMLIFLVMKAGFSSRLNFSEHFGTSRGSPDFWEIGTELAAYRRKQSPGFTPENKGKASAKFASEHLRSDMYSRLSTAGASRQEHLKSDHQKSTEDALLSTQMWKSSSKPNFTGLSRGIGSDQI